MASRPAKVMPPRLPPVVARSRLLDRLDRLAGDAECLWVEGPAGAGKTTLALQWLERSRRPSVWYHVDAADDDPATLCHYLAVAISGLVGESTPALPVPTAEYRGGIEAFFRSYFHALASHLPHDTLFVFDGVHEVEREGAFMRSLEIAISVLGPDQCVLCVSRTAPPGSLMRPGGEPLARLRWEELCLTREEAHAIAVLRGAEGRRPLIWSSAGVDRMYEETQGWAAGLLWMLENAAQAPASSALARDHTELLFDYFASEILARLPASTRSLLFLTAFLPEVSAESAATLTGNAGAERVLKELVANNHFTVERAGAEPRYEYHRLFRDFLKATAEKQLPAAELSRAKERAAELLASAGRFEDAAALYRELGRVDALAVLLRDQAPRLIARGRYRALREWLEAVPEPVVYADAWLSYWQGMARLPFDPASAEPYFLNAYFRFRSENAASGVLLAWSGVVDAIWSAQLDFRRTVPFIERLEQDLETYPIANEDPDAIGRVAGSLLWALLWGSFDRPLIERWVRRAEGVWDELRDARTRLRLGNALLRYYQLCGRPADALALYQTQRKLADPDAPEQALEGLIADLLLYAHAGPAERVTECLQRAHALAESSGIHVFDATMIGLGLWSVLGAGDTTTVDALLEEMGRILAPMPVTLNTALWHLNRSFCLRIEEKHDAAVHHAEEALRMAQGAGSSVPVVWCNQMLAHAHLEKGNIAGASQQAEIGLEAARRLGLVTLEASFTLLQARIAFARGDAPTALSCLRQGLSARIDPERLEFMSGWRGEDVSALFARALEHGLCVSTVREAIRGAGLLPPSSCLPPDLWPMPLKIYALGELRILIDGRPLIHRRKIPKKPLELLKALVALGGRNIGEDELAEALWPEAEADAAAAALGSTVHRLRKLVGEQTVVRKAGRLTLDPRRAWVDVWQFERYASLLSYGGRSSSPNEQRVHVEKLAALYRGPFLEGDPETPWILEARARLERRHAHLMHVLGVRAQAPVISAAE